MAKNNGKLEIICIGLDSFSIEAIKKSFRENKVDYHFSYIQEVGDLASFGKREADAVFFQSNRQSQKTIDDIRRIRYFIPRAAITLLSPRPEVNGIVGSFRAGLFDFLSLPVDADDPDRSDESGARGSPSLFAPGEFLLGERYFPKS